MQQSGDDTYRITSILPDRRFPLEPYRSPWRRDLARLLHSPSFRRLQGKTQLFPGQESDFFRNRLTHSLEVAQIAKSIAIKLNYELEEHNEQPFIEPDITEFAALAHDLGHPPFGHFGEDVLDEKMCDLGGFEGNAQTLRILGRTEKRHLIPNTEFGIDSSGDDKRIGLNLAVRSIASVLKYDNEIPQKRNKDDEVVKGYYYTERNLVNTVKEQVTNGKKYSGNFKTIECQIMDIADDIAYSTYDLEDSFKAGFIKPIDLICAPDEILENVAKKVSGSTKGEITKEQVRGKIQNIFFDIFAPPVGEQIIGEKLTKELYEFLHFFSIESANKLSNLYANDGYYRTDLTSKLVGLAIRKISIKEVNKIIPVLSTIEVEREREINIEILKHYIYESQIMSPKIQVIARRSREIVETIFDALSEDNKKDYSLLPSDFKRIYLALKDDILKKRVICDFVASMTDRYALEFYGRLTSENPQTIFKPF